MSLTLKDIVILWVILGTLSWVRNMLVHAITALVIKGYLPGKGLLERLVKSRPGGFK